MAYVILQTQSLPEWNWGGTTGKVRVFASQSFYEKTTSALIPQGQVTNINSACQVYDTTISGTVMTIPEITLATTTDSNVPNVVYTAVVYDRNDVPRYTLLSQFFVDPDYFQTPAQSSILVTDAGTSAANQFYTYRDQQAGYAYYNVEGEDNSITLSAIVNTGSQWRIYNASGTNLYHTSDNPNDPWDGTWVVTSGALPVPTVAEDLNLVTTTWEQLTLSNQASATVGAPYQWNGPFWNVEQTKQYVNSLVGDGTTPYAARNRIGKTALDTDPVLSTNPIAVGVNSSRLGYNLYYNYGNSLVTAFNEIGSDEVTLDITVPADTLTTNLTFDNNVSFNFLDSGLIPIGANTTLTIGALPIDPGPQQRFTLADSTSHVIFAPGAVDRINTAWWTGPGTSAGVAIDRAYNEALLSCAGGVAQNIYTPWGKWTGTGNHVIPGHTNVYGDGQFATLFYNTSSTTPWFKMGPNTQFVTFRDFQINGIIGAATSGTGILMEGAVADEVSGTGFIDLYNVILQANHYGFRINATDDAWSAVAIGIHKGCSLLGNDYNVYNNSPNTNIDYHAHQLVAWIQTDSPSPGDGYSQYLGYADHCGPLTITGEQGGMFPAGDEFGYGRCQRQMITVQAGDNITVAGTAVARVTAAGMRGDGSLVAGGDFTAVAATDILTLASHGFYTGLIVRLTTAGVLPVPLAINTDYYVIKINANTFYLATTLDNATSGTHIDLLTDGTPVNTVTAQATALGSPVLIDIPLALTGGVFTASSATDVITLPGHGFNTGQAVTVSTTGTLPSPLVAATTYYLTVIDADTFYIAATLTDAFSNIHINLLTNGTPTNTMATLDAENTIAAQIRFALGHNPWISSFFHITKTWTIDYSLDDRVNLIALEPADTDTIMSFSWVPGTCTGLTAKPTSVRTGGSPDKLAEGWAFTGHHYGTMWLNSVDEGFHSLLLANADELESAYTFIGGVIQSPVRLNKKCNVTISGGDLYDRCIRDGGTGPSPTPTYFGSPRVKFDGIIQYYSNVWVDDGAGDKVATIELMQCRRDSNFANIQYDNYNNAMHSLRVDNHEQLVDSNYDLTLYHTEDEQTADNEALVPASRAQLNLVSFSQYDPKDMLFIGNGDTLGNGRYGYFFRRLESGALQVIGNQADQFSGILTNKIYAPGLISEIHPESSSPNITANTTDYNPTFLWDQNIMQVNAQGGSWILRSMLAPTQANGAMYDGWNGVFTNTNSSNTLTLPNEDAAGTAEYRFLTPGAVDFYLGPQCSCYLYYDLVRERWIVADLGILTTSITNGDVTHAPDGNAVFDALALKADTSAMTAALALKGDITGQTFVTPNIGVATGTSLAVTGLLKSSGTAGIGYAAGASGTASGTWAGGATLNKTTGQITLDSKAFSANTSYSVAIANSTYAVGDSVIVGISSGAADPSFYGVNWAHVSAGNFLICVRSYSNPTETLVFDIKVIKGS